MIVVLPTMPAAQEASWHGVLDVSERLAGGWTIIGGQMVHLHCAERGQAAIRPTTDVDTVVDVRADSKMLRTFTEALCDAGFEADGISVEGHQHRWKRDQASIDVLIPDGAGERANKRTGATGSPSVSTSGGSQALRRSEQVSINVNGRVGAVWRPNLVGALIAKAAAHSHSAGRDPRRHRSDFVALASMLWRDDFSNEKITPSDRRNLNAMIGAIKADGRLLLELPVAKIAIARLVEAAGL